MVLDMPETEMKGYIGDYIYRGYIGDYIGIIEKENGNYCREYRVFKTAVRVEKAVMFALMLG